MRANGSQGVNMDPKGSGIIDLAGALLVLLFGLLVSIGAIWYRMRGMELRGEFDQGDRRRPRRKP